MSDIGNIRKEIAKLHKAVTNKINRTRRNTGAKLSGSSFDPRKNAGTENRMRSEANLTEYARNLKAFMSPSNQFIAGSGGAPLRKGYFNRVFKSNENALNQVQNVRDSTIGAIQGPAGFTVKQNSIAINKAGGASVYGPYKRFDRSPSDITSQSAMEKLNRDMVNQMKPNYLPGKLDKERERLQQVVDYLGENGTELSQTINAMDDYEFDLFWFGTNVASGIFLFYELEKERAEGNHKEKAQDRVIESKFQEVKPAAEWAMNEGRKKREADVAAQQANLRANNKK